MRYSSRVDRRARILSLALVALTALVVVVAWGSDGEPGPPAGSNSTARSGDATTMAAASDAAASRADAVAAERSVVEVEPSRYAQLLRATATGYTGRVVTARGEVVPGIGVTLLRVAATAVFPAKLDLFDVQPAEPQVVAAEALTDARGRFVLDGIAPRGVCFLRLAFEDPDTAPVRFRSGQRTYVPVERAPAPGEVVDLGDVMLKVGATIVGRVVDPDGPVEGALVRAARLPPLPFGVVPIERLRADGGLIGTPGDATTFVEFPPWFEAFWDALPIAMTHSRADGSFAIHGVDPGAVVVAAIAPGRASRLLENVRTRAGETTGVGELRLPYGATTSVFVVDAAGEPVADARVFVAPMSMGLPVHVAEPAGTTNGAGRVAVDGLPVGRAIAAAARQGSAVWHYSEPASAEGTLRVVFPERHTLTLRVLDLDGAPIARPDVQLVPGAADHGVVELALLGARRPIDLSRRLGRLPDGRLRIAELDAGEWTLLVGAPGFATHKADLTLTADAERTVELRGARELRVRTIDPRGEPVADATIYVRSRGASRNVRLIELPRPVGRTREDGWLSISDLPTTTTRITAEHPRHGQVHREVDGTPGELELRFEEAASITGVLTDGGRPPEPGRWVMVLERRYGDGELRRGAMPEMPQLTVPDLEGNFRFAALQPGKWRVTAQDSVADVSTVAGFMEYSARRKQIFPWNKAEVLLQGGERAEVRLDAIVDAAPFDGPGAFVRGSVVLDGAPAIGAVVVGTSKKPERRVTSRVDGGGWFELGRVPAGELRLVVVSQEVADSRLRENVFNHLWARDLRITADEPRDIRVVLDTGVVFGHVTNEHGQPASDCRMRIFDRGGDGRSSSMRSARSKAGAFRFEAVPAGHYELLAESDTGRAVRGGVVVTSGGVVGPIDLVMQPFARLAGQVLQDNAPPPRGSSLRLYPAGGGHTLRRGLEKDGSFAFDRIVAGDYRGELRTPSRELDLGNVRVLAPVTAGVTLRASTR